jgi:hypothetical protein
MNANQIEILQHRVCQQYRAEHIPALGEVISGFASITEDRLPINGLRHSQTGETTGWYIWCGEEFSHHADFFQPIHTKHLYEKHPSIAPLLGLPPGYRFIQAGEYVDVWFDPSLLAV